MTLTYPTPEDIWNDFTGGESPRDFVVRMGGESVEACVDMHLGGIPDAMGIMRNGNWGKSFRQPWQLRRDEVRHGLLAYLEQHREVWAVPEEEYTPELRGDSSVPAEEAETNSEGLATTDETPASPEEAAESGE
ncbi:MAG: hypothetical protein RLZZ303_2908 [Candidatus Hydrogenedentota bacterium]|jgi:hypothetical protein